MSNTKEIYIIIPNISVLTVPMRIFILNTKAIYTTILNISVFTVPWEYSYSWLFESIIHLFLIRSLILFYYCVSALTINFRIVRFIEAFLLLLMIQEFIWLIFSLIMCFANYNLSVNNRRMWFRRPTIWNLDSISKQICRGIICGYTSILKTKQNSNRDCFFKLVPDYRISVIMLLFRNCNLCRDEKVKIMNADQSYKAYIRWLFDM